VSEFKAQCESPLNWT